MSQKKNDTIGERIAKSGLGTFVGGLGGFAADLVKSAMSGSETAKGKQSGNALEVDFKVQVDGLMNRICQEDAGDLVRIKDSSTMKFAFRKDKTITTEQLEYILTGKDYDRKGSK